ncbi:hypothetical protein TNCV_2117591 [Trichonephila clavipes]|nr:hypothetical protein TNCV_2117591 [Trichonephila clavipes]
MIRPVGWRDKRLFTRQTRQTGILYTLENKRLQRRCTRFKTASTLPVPQPLGFLLHLGEREIACVGDAGGYSRGSHGMDHRRFSCHRQHATTSNNSCDNHLSLHF